jgi:hypothetical protein
VGLTPPADMRARAAYISSLGTTTILVCAALLLLAVGSALVAFRGWPGGANGTGVQRVTLPSKVSPRFATALVRASAVTRLVRAQRPKAGAARLSTAGLVKVPPGTGPVVNGVVIGPGSSGVSVSSPPGARYPAPNGSPFQAPPPTGRYPSYPTSPPVDPGVTVPLPVPAPHVGVVPPSAPAAVTAVATSVLSSAPPPPAGGSRR